MTFAAGFLLLLWVLTSIFANGIAIVHRSTKLRGLDLIGYGAAAGVLLHALVGCAIGWIPAIRSVVVAILIALTVVSAIYLIARRVMPEFRVSLSRSSKVSLAIWALLPLLCLGLLHLEVRFPESLPDGLYVFKAHTTNVKTQYLVGLPADNYIPFAVAEFILRGVSFKKERPILPANEVSNRTILMSLVALPFRVALGARRDHPNLGTYSYIGRKWPDVSQLDTGNSFDQFAVIGLALNSLLLLGLFVFSSSLDANSILPAAALLYLTNPYFIAQTIYTWPKALAGFFILLAWTSLRRHHGPIVVAALMALAYHSHPYAIVFAGCIGIFYLAQWRREKRQLPSIVPYLVVFGLMLVPWIFWTKVVLHVPSDLITQNFAGPETAAAWASPINFIWIRFYNLFYLLCPVSFVVYPFDLSSVVNYYLYCLPGVVGLVLIYPAIANCATLAQPRPWLWYGLLGPALLIVAIYSCPAFPVLHGYQPLIGVLLFLGVWWLSRNASRSVCLGFLGLQLLMNLSVVWARGLLTGAHF